MKKYKVILNIGYKNEEIIYFDKLTQKRLQELLNSLNYITLYYDNYLRKYVVFDRSSKLNEYQVALFNNNLDYYCK